MERRSLLHFVRRGSIGPGDMGRLTWALDTKNVRNAVAAVMVNARFAATNCQYVPQILSTVLTVPPVRNPAMWVMVQIMVRMVRQSEDDRAIFCVHRILTFQISRQGM